MVSSVRNIISPIRKILSAQSDKPKEHLVDAGVDVRGKDGNQEGLAGEKKEKSSR